MLLPAVCLRNDPVSALIVEGLEVRESVRCGHATRLRCTVKDAALVKQDVLKASGASGVICKGNGVHGWCTVPKVAVIKAKAGRLSGKCARPRQRPRALAPATAPQPRQQPQGYRAVCYLNGTVVPLAGEGQPLPAGTLGDGIAIEPIDGELVAPAQAVNLPPPLGSTMPMGMTTVDGAELLMHIGIDHGQTGRKALYLPRSTGDKVKKVSR